MNTPYHWDPFRGLNTLNEQVNRLLGDSFPPSSDWSPAVDIYEAENELVVKADLPDVSEKDIDIRIENDTLAITDERKFEPQFSEDNYLRLERAYGTFSRSFSLPNTVNTEAIQADYHHGLLTVHLPKREESKPKQIKVAVSTNGR
jgi:HSP20 family protein